MPKLRLTLRWTLPWALAFPREFLPLPERPPLLTLRNDRHHLPVDVQRVWGSAHPVLLDDGANSAYGEREGEGDEEHGLPAGEEVVHATLKGTYLALRVGKNR